MNGLMFLVYILSGLASVRRQLESGRLGLNDLLLQSLFPQIFSIQAGSLPFEFWKYWTCVYCNLRYFQVSNPTEEF